MPGHAVHGVGVAAVIAVGAAVLVVALVTLWPVAGAAIARQATDTRDAALLESALIAEILMGLAVLVTMITAAVLVIIWLYRARLNLDSMAVAATGPRPGWAIGGWFVPIANLVIPFRVMAAVVRGSLPQTGRLEGLLWIWWLAWVCGTGLDQILSSVDNAAYDALPTPVLTQDHFEAYVGYYQDQLLRYLPGGLLTILAGTLLIVLILRVSRGQEECLTAAPPPAPILPGVTAPAPPTA